MKLSEEDLVEMSTDPLVVFYSSLKSVYTKRNYTRDLKYFICGYLEDILSGSFEERAVQLLNLAKSDQEKTGRILYAYAKALKEKTDLPRTDPNYRGTSAVLNRFKPIQKFFEMNDVLFNWKRLRSTLPEKRYDYPNMRGYSKEEIIQILKFSTGPTNTSIVLIASSSGIRTGAFNFKWGDVKPVYKKDDQIILEPEKDDKDLEIACAIIFVYRGEREEYPAFITPEAYRSLLDHKLNWIRKTKREPADSDYVFKKPGPGNIQLGVTAITQRIAKLIYKAGMRRGLEESQKRYSVPVMHGFRKFFNKTIKNTPSGTQFIGQYIIKERMMGHSSLVGLEKNYYKEDIVERIEEYLKCVPYLTISELTRLKTENMKLKKEKSDLERQLPNLVNNAVTRAIEHLSKDGWTV